MLPSLIPPRTPWHPRTGSTTPRSGEADGKAPVQARDLPDLSDTRSPTLHFHIPPEPSRSTTRRPTLAIRESPSYLGARCLHLGAAAESSQTAHEHPSRIPDISKRMRRHCELYPQTAPHHRLREGTLQ